MFKTDEDLALANQYFEAQEYEKAEQIYDQLSAPGVHLTPSQNAKLLFQTAMLYKHQGKREEAAEQLRALFHEGLHNSQPYNQTRALHEQGILAYEEQKYKEAISLFRKELRIWHSHMEHYFRSLSLNFLWQGRCFMELGDWTEAAIYLKHAETFAGTEENAKAEGIALEEQVRLRFRMGDSDEAENLFMHTLAKYSSAGLSEDAVRFEKEYESLSTKIQEKDENNE